MEWLGWALSRYPEALMARSLKEAFHARFGGAMQAGGTQQQSWGRVEHMIVDFATSFVRRNLIDRRDGLGSGSQSALEQLEK